MESENPFKNVEIVSGNEISNCNPQELIFLEDDDSDSIGNRMITSIQLELHTENGHHTMPFQSDEEEDFHPLNVRIEPVEKQASDNDDECVLLAPKSECINLLSQDDEEQFEIIGRETDVEDNEKKFSVLAASPNRPTSPKSQDLNESLGNIHDHSYFQSQDVRETSFCEDIVQDILKESNQTPNANALSLLSTYTSFIRNIVVTDDERESQMSQYLNQMSTALENMKNKEKEEPPPLLPIQMSADEVAINVNLDGTLKTEEENQEQMSQEPSDDNITDEAQLEDSMMSIKEEIPGSENSEENVTVKLENLSFEAIEQIQSDEIATAVKDEKEDAAVTNDDFNAIVDKFKVCIQKAQTFSNRFMESNQKLLESVFVSQDDMDNGQKKFIISLRNLVSDYVKLIAEIDGKDKELSEKDFSDMEVDASDSDDSIRRLIDLNSLKHQKSKKSAIGSTKAVVKEEKEKKKKLKERKSDLSDLGSDSDSDLPSDVDSASISSKTREKFSDGEKESESDEEDIMRKKLEDKAKADLLKSSDDEGSDESSYKTSDSSLPSSDDEHDSENEAGKIAIENKVEVKPKNERENQEAPRQEKENQEEEAPPSKTGNAVKSESIIKEEKTENPSQQSRKKKVVKRTSLDREVMGRSFLSDKDTDDEVDDHDKSKSPRSKIIKRLNKTSTDSADKANTSSDVIDLSAFENHYEHRPADLERFFEKRATQSEYNDNAEPCDLSKVKQQQPETPKKNDQKSTNPSPIAINEDDPACISLSSESDSEISSTNAEGRQIRRRKQLTEEELKEETKKAKKEENERVKKLEAKTARMSEFLSQRLSQADVIEENELILDFSEKKNLEIKVHPRLVDKLKKHQIDGVKFMYNNCYGSVDDVKPNNGSGCILAHCMGLGKTLQLIVLLHTVIRYDELCTNRVLVICPKSTIYNWHDEFRKWLSKIELSNGKRITVKFLEDNIKIDQKVKCLEEWFDCKNASVFLINYESFRQLVNWTGTHKRMKVALSDTTIKNFQTRISRCLLDPGPDLVVCDEGHLIKNQKGATNKAVTKIATKRRIILTGTPVQNALHEYYAMVQWIKPNLLGTLHEFNLIYANPIKDGQSKDSTASEIKKMKQKSYVLNKNLSKFVQRMDAGVLREFLPIKHEYCISVPLTDVQEKLYNFYLEKNRNDHMGKQLLPHYTALRKIWTHPKVLQLAYERAIKGENKFVSNHQQMQSDQRSRKNAFDEDGEDDKPDDIFDTSQGLTAVNNDWWSKMITKDDVESLLTSHKMILLFEILRSAERKNEKVLVFSSFVAVLDVIEKFMKAIHKQDENPKAEMYGYKRFKTSWELGKDYYRLDGSTPKSYRQTMIHEFNRPGSKPRCFLISAKAGGQGINLTAANRCIIIDTSWNPANDNQNIFRIYRLGQTQTCFVYRFVAASTMEERVYSRSVTKEAMSHRVVEKKQIERHYVKDELNELFVSYKLKPRDGVLNFPKDETLRDLLLYFPQSTYNFHEHDSLLENKPEDDLDEDEKKEAWQSYITESTQTNRMNNVASMTANNPLTGKTSDLLKYLPEMMLSSQWMAGYDPGNLATSAPSTSYNANNIPPATNSIFAQPSTSISNSSSLISASSPLPPPPPAHQKPLKIKPVMKSLAGVTKPVSQQQKKTSPQSVAGTQRMPLLSASKAKVHPDPLIIPQNSSQNLSILPDNSEINVSPRISSSSGLAISSVRSEGTSARTSIIPKTKVGAMPSTKMSPSTSSLNAIMRRPVSYLKTKSGVVKNIPATQGQSVLKSNVARPMLKQQQQQQPLNMQRPQMMKVNLNSNNVSSSSSNNMQNQRQKFQVLQRVQTQTPPKPSSIIKNVNYGDSSKLSATVSQVPASKPGPVSGSSKPNPTTFATPPKALASQLERNQVTLIDTSKKTPSPRPKQIPSNLLPQSSISIIKLPPQSSLARSVSQSSLQVTTSKSPLTSKTLSQTMSTHNLPQTVQKSAKRKAETEHSNYNENAKKTRVQQSSRNAPLVPNSQDGSQIIDCVEIDD